LDILLIEDDRKLSRAMTALLEEEEHTVAVAYDGEQGLLQGTQNTYEAIILDVMLPLMNGFEVCQALRANCVKTPVLMLTARVAVDDRVNGLDAGADDYLAKPFAFSELMARLRALTRRQIDLQNGDRLQVAGLALDLRRRRAEYGGQTIELSPTEFGLLEVLMRNEGRVLKQAQILDHVWGYDSWPESNLVPVYVTYLRRKFNLLKIPVEIKAVRGVGYVMEA
jgi:DNA-binding response OmpR family regulator